MKKIRRIAGFAATLALGGCGAAFGPAGGVPAYAFNFALDHAPGTLTSAPATTSMPMPNGATVQTTPAAAPAQTVAADPATPSR
jgi:hypothetical protein